MKLKDILKSTLKEGKSDISSDWNTISKMVASYDGKFKLEDIGLKRSNGIKYHEFMIDNRSNFVILCLDDTRLK